MALRWLESEYATSPSLSIVQVESSHRRRADLHDACARVIRCDAPERDEVVVAQFVHALPRLVADGRREHGSQPVTACRHGKGVGRNVVHEDDVHACVIKTLHGVVEGSELVSFGFRSGCPLATDQHGRQLRALEDRVEGELQPRRVAEHVGSAVDRRRDIRPRKALGQSGEQVLGMAVAEQDDLRGPWPLTVDRPQCRRCRARATPTRRGCLCRPGHSRHPSRGRAVDARSTLPLLRTPVARSASPPPSRWPPARQTRPRRLQPTARLSGGSSVEVAERCLHPAIRRDGWDGAQDCRQWCSHRRQREQRDGKDDHRPVPEVEGVRPVTDLDRRPRREEPRDDVASVDDNPPRCRESHPGPEPGSTCPGRAWSRRSW